MDLIGEKARKDSISGTLRPEGNSNSGMRASNCLESRCVMIQCSLAYPTAIRLRCLELILSDVCSY